jgi:transcriptional regulator with XRE-family HTH domain
MARDDKDRDLERGRRIQQRRKAVRGRTQAAVGRLIGASERTVSEWERGYVVPAIKLQLLADALGTTPEYLLGESDDPETGDADLDKRLARGEQSARAGFGVAAQRIAEVNDAVTALQTEMEKLRLSVAAQGEAQQTMLLQLQGLRRDVQALATTDRPGASERTRGKAQRPPRQANH